MSLSAVRRTTLAFLLLLVTGAASGQTVFPGKQWQVDKPEAQSMSSEGLEKVGAWLKANGSKTGMVVRHGRIVGQWYFDDATADSKFPVYSTTKSFASTALNGFSSFHSGCLGASALMRSNANII